MKKLLQSRWTFLAGWCLGVLMLWLTQAVLRASGYINHNFVSGSSVLINLASGGLTILILTLINPFKH